MFLHCSNTAISASSKRCDSSSKTVSKAKLNASTYIELFPWTHLLCPSLSCRSKFLDASAALVASYPAIASLSVFTGGRALSRSVSWLVFEYCSSSSSVSASESATSRDGGLPGNEALSFSSSDNLRDRELSALSSLFRRLAADVWNSSSKFVDGGWRIRCPSI